MYILLRGQVTIFILYAKPTEGDDGKKVTAVPNIDPDSGESIRKQLGTFVTNLGIWSIEAVRFCFVLE